FKDTAPWYAIGALDWSGQVGSATTFSDISANTFTNTTAELPWSDTGVFRNRTNYDTTTGSNTVDGIVFNQLLTGANGTASTLTGGSGPDYIAGQGANDVINGGNGADSLSGNSGNDVITGGAGNDTITGGTGIDTASFSGNYSSYSFSFSGTAGSWSLIVTGPDGTDTLTSIEQLTFTDSAGITVRVAGFGGYASIDAAIAAATSDSPDDDVILIEPGTYSG
ncbi:MAG: calcium-binding protein, partial [Planctomycetaceae bacterium]